MKTKEYIPAYNLLLKHGYISRVEEKAKIVFNTLIIFTQVDWNETHCN